jgi:hypothetical protein
MAEGTAARGAFCARLRGTRSTPDPNRSLANLWAAQAGVGLRVGELEGFQGCRGWVRSLGSAHFALGRNEPAWGLVVYQAPSGL